jgi:ribonuclease-3
MRFGIIKPGDTSGSGKDGDEGDETETGETEAGEEAPPSGPRDYSSVEDALGYKFKEIRWLERALTHRSVQAKGAKNDYERLEFLGDAVLDLAVAQLLLDTYPEAREGELSKMRAALVNTFLLAEIARSLKLGPYIRLSRGETASGGADRPSILADVIEAIMGAIYRESGYDSAFKTVQRLFGDRLTTVTPRDPKTELQEALHAAGSDAPVYLLECVEGPEHAPTFISVVQVDGQIVGRGRGATKKASQQAAAEQALAQLKGGDEIDKEFLNQDDAAKAGGDKDEAEEQ